MLVMDFRFNHIAALDKAMHSHSSSLFSKAQSMRVDHYIEFCSNVRRFYVQTSLAKWAVKSLDVYNPLNSWYKTHVILMYGQFRLRQTAEVIVVIYYYNRFNYKIGRTVLLK